MTAGVEALLRRSYAWACERLYHELAWQYDHVSVAVSANRWDAWRRLALDEVRSPDGDTDAPLLELGFGTGELLLAAGQSAAPLVGLELSPRMHAVADAKLRRQKVTALRVQATALNMPFRADSFAAIIATFPSPYIFQSQTLDECWRVLCSGGRLVVLGLWVTPVVRRHRLNMPLLYGEPSAEMLAQIVRRVDGAGFDVEVITRFAGDAEVGGLVAHKRSISKGNR